MPRSPRRRFKVASLGLAIVASLALLEVGFRIRAHRANTRTLSAAFEVAAAPDAGGRTRFIDIIQESQNDNLIYELRPNLDVVFKDLPMRTNSHGFRSPEVPYEAPPDTRTIVGIGASIMFGHGVSEGEEYPRLLEDRLNARDSKVKWRFVNTSVPSYNVVMKVETLVEKGLAFQPDLVLLNIAGNNLDLPQYIRKHEDVSDMRRSFLLDFFRDREARREEHESRNAKLAFVEKKRLRWRETMTTHPQSIPERFRDLVGWDPFIGALDRLQGLSELHGFPVVVFANLEVDLVPEMLEACRERGFHTVSLMPDLVAYIEHHTKQPFTLHKYVRTHLVVSRENLHPSARQHTLAADRLERALEEIGLLEPPTVPTASANQGLLER